MVALAAVVAAATVALGVPVHTPVWDDALGGRLYDRWYEVLMVEPPQQRHPLYRSVMPLPAEETWRCTTCHGWDYRGVAGLGPSLRPMGLREPADIAGLVSAPAHGFGSDTLTPVALGLLSGFLANGQIDAVDILAPSGAALGDWKYGAWLFTQACGQCHGNIGDQIELRAEGLAATLGERARENPWRTLHKIRFGEPGTGMLASILLSKTDFADLMAYAQRLP